MKWVVSLVIAGGIARFGSADVLDLGDLAQYNAQLTSLPGTGTNAVWLGQGGDGYDIAFSADIKSKVQGVLDGCGDFNDKCYQDVNTVFSRADVEIDAALDRRGFASLLSKTFKSYVDIFLDITVILIAMFKMRQQEVQELGIWLPNSRASDVWAIGTATAITISAGGIAVATITQTPDVTQLQGSATPVVTAVTAPSDGYDSGDLVALLDTDLAARIDEFMRRSTDCLDGQTFDSQHPTKKRAGSTLGQAICAAEAVAAGTVPGGAFNDLLLLSPTNLPFGFADGVGAVAQAAGVVADFVQVYAPLLDIGPDLADQLTVYIFALAMDTIVQNIPLTNKNRIQSSLITTATSTPTTTTARSTSSGCPDPTATPLSCGMDGEDCDIKMPVAPATQPSCQSGKFQGCPCDAPPVISVNLVLPVEQYTMIYLSDLLSSAAAAPPLTHSPECQTGVTDIPANIFSSDQNKVYSQFCDAWTSGTTSKITADSSGNNRSPQLQLGRRTPPPDATHYTDWNFDLSFTTAAENVKCSTDCNGAFTQLGHACSSYGSTVSMHSSGTLDADCGVFSFNIYHATTALEEQTRFCYGAQDFGPTGSIDDSTVRWDSGWPCTGTALKTVKKGDTSTFIHWHTTENGVPYQYNVWWKDGCTLENDGPTEVFASNPLGIDNPGYTVCQDYLIGDYTECKDNAGVGGNIQVGCLIYEFMANTQERVF